MNAILKLFLHRANTLLLLVGAWLVTAAPTLPERGPEARLLRFPDIHGDFVVFVYGGDIWRAPSAGGEARRLTSHVGVELFPKISHDGRFIAYSAEYSGSRQVFVMPAAGGPPKQLTFYTDVGRMAPRGGWDYWIQDWTAEGKILVRMNRTPWGRRMGRYFLVDPAGGLEVPLALPEGGSASLSPDGKALAYTPISREFRTWKRTRGGRAQDVWIYDLEDHQSRRLTEHPGTDNFPLWSDETIYFTSDREDTLNLFAQGLDGGEPRKVTDFRELDVLWPSLGPGSIVFMKGGELYRFDLESEQSVRIPIRIGGDLPLTVPHFVNLRNSIEAAALSPSGKRVLLTARGEVFSVPAERGAIRNLSRTQGVRERGATWSPDGDSIAYFSDASGEYELYLRPSKGTGEARQLTQGLKTWPYPAVWSPDSGRLAFGDRSRRLWVIDVASGEMTEVDHGHMDDLDTYVWSPDGRWLAYEKFHPSRLPAIYLYSLDGKASFALGDGLTPNFAPAFSSDGKHLFFLSNRDYQLRFSAFEFNYIYDHATRVYAAALDPSATPLFPLRSDEEEGSASGE